MHSIAPDDLPARDAYRLMLSAIIPRPIAWVSTVGPDGTPNLAPFSFFTGVAGNPPVVLISVSAKSARFGGGIKDTLRNAQTTGEFVVNLVDEAHAEAMNQTAGEWPYGVSEFDLAGLEAMPSVEVAPPRVASAPVALECKVHQIIPVDGTTNTLLLGRVVRYHVRANLLRENGLIDAMQARPLARLGGSEYATLGGVFALERPQVKRDEAAK
ncbi:MAG: flavin reductase family protein [Anaerolineae bacterium]|nr:flavin reductase family protein [Anaerolineae bacterium]